MSRADILMEAAAVARTIADRCRALAAEKTGDDRGFDNPPTYPAPPYAGDQDTGSAA